ncbi:MAG: DUF2726 domain-containing protein [Candidatus Delongbacteria bacterium]|nr:DUF2726 domain-containing protein [Candidatus Delongbacteria bacterium]
MKNYILIICFLILGGIILNFLKKLEAKMKPKTKFPFEKKESLLNDSERKFFENLQQIIPPGYIVFPQVSLKSIVKVRSSKQEFQSYHNKISKKVIDFVIFEKQFLKPVVAIEYDGKTHSITDRQDRDNFVNNVFETVGMTSSPMY